MASIDQNLRQGVLPDFRNVGVLMRVLIAVIAMELAAAVTHAPTWREALREFVETSAFAQPALIACLVVLAACSGWLRTLPYRVGLPVVVAIVLAVTALVYRFGQDLLVGTGDTLDRNLAFALVASGALLMYFDLRGRALSPALTEARLQALQARIRPHFLFNSINAVLSLIRAEPKRAEQALEDMAELFRVMLADNNQLSPLGREIDLCRQYLNLEQLRLGERLVVDWQVDDSAQQAMVPPLVLQPVIENAVYHGIEPRIEPGTVRVRIEHTGKRLEAIVSNPYQDGDTHHAGNRMALANIRERLLLHFDAEASVETRVTAGLYEVRIRLPFLAQELR